MKVTLDVPDPGPPIPRGTQPFEVSQRRAARLCLDICRAYGVLHNMPTTRRSDAADAQALIYALSTLVPWDRLAASLEPLTSLTRDSHADARP